MFNSYQLDRFAIRKYAVGVCSVLVASLMFLGAPVSAEQVTATAQAETSQLLQLPPQEELLSDQEATGLVGDDNLPTESPEALSSKEDQSSVVAQDLSEEQAQDEQEVGEQLPAESLQDTSQTDFPSPETVTPELIMEEPLKEAAVAPATGTGFRRAAQTRSLAGVIGDDYPARWKNQALNSAIDDWRLYNRNCTSFSAYRLSSANGFELPPAYGNAGEWGNRARREGYHVDNNPTRGSIAWGAAGGAHSSYGHVAWVSDVSGDKVTIEEYNYLGDGRYHTRTVHKSAFTGYIHFKDLTVPAVHPSQPARGELVVQNHNTQTGDFEVLITKVSNGGGVREVRVPIWSEKGGQDDMVWYRAEYQGGTTYRVKVKASNHRHDTGTYHIHAYYIQNNGEQVGVTNRTFEVKRGEATTSSVKVDVKKRDQAGDFDVVLSQVSHKEDVEKILVPIWSEQGGQDDIVWYEAKRQSHGTYKVSVDISKHKHDMGIYHIHTYLRQYNEELVGAGTTQTTVERPKVTTGANLTIHNHHNGNFDVIVSNISHDADIAAIQIPTWSENNGQDDIVWYNAVAQGDGTYKVSVDVSNHRHDVGLYHAHLYFRQTDGKQVFVVSATTVAGQQDLAPSGSYHFTKTLPIKAQASMASTTLDYYYAGETVNYDRVLVAEGRQWISYLSYGGARRYIPLT